MIAGNIFPAPEAQMLAKKPEEVNQLFIEYMRNGDLESVLELYDPEMAFVNPVGEIKRGIPAIRGELSEFAATKQLFQFHIRNGSKTGILRSFTINGK
jgi:ketosteroid isomerase-like protein